MENPNRYSLLKSISVAFSGIVKVIQYERNFKIHLLVAPAVVLLGILVGLTKAEWLAIITIIFVMFATEALNSAIEETCNVMVEKLKLGYQETKLIRDIAAGAALLVAIGAIILGLIIFLPYFLV